MTVGARVIRLLLLRHAQSENNEAGINDSAVAADVRAAGIRQADPALSERGFAQSGECAKWMARQLGPHIAHIHISPMTRALQTAAPLVRALPDVPVSLRLDAFECGGCFNGPRTEKGVGHELATGCDAREILELVPSLRLPPGGLPGGIDSGWWRGGFESDDESRARAGRLCEWAWSQVPAEVSQAEPEVVVLVTHGFFMSYMLQQLFCAGPTSATAPATTFLSANCAIWLLELRVDGGDDVADATSAGRSVGVLAAGRTDHIPVMHRSGQHLAGFRIPSFAE
jgi:broad specificity phosphatase PhoE